MKMWAEARPIARDDEVDRYLRARGLGMDAYPENLRCHPGLGYYEVDGSGKSTLLRNIPAMLALMQDASGEYVSLHRTYIEGGHKALVPNPKKCLTTFPNGAVIRLFESTDELALAEGIETALALHLAIGRPVWATYSATNMEHVAVPPSVHRVRIYADHDRNFVGQSAAFLLARRLMTENHGQDEREIRVFIPVSCGTDWADIWVARVNKEARAA
jgi:putative DNA primase/helicase